MVKHRKGTSPPGFASANVSINLEQLCELAEITEDLHELKVGMINTWLDSLEVGPDVYKSEDESPILPTVLDLSDSEMEGESPDIDSSAASRHSCCSCENSHPRESCSDSVNIKGIWHSMSERLDEGLRPVELPQFGGLFDHVRQVIDLYMGKLALESDSCSRDSALADAILQHFNSTKANVIRNAETLRKVDRIVNQVVGNIAWDLWTTLEALTDNEYAVSECETGSCPDLQAVLESEPSEPSDSSTETSESSSSSSDLATRCSGNDFFEQTFSSSEVDWAGMGTMITALIALWMTEPGKSNIGAKANNIVFAYQTWNNSSLKEISPC